MKPLPPGPKDLAPALVNVLVEIPMGSRIKYEMDHDTGLVSVDRVLFSPLHYPAEYGFIPSTLALDGDPCDALVLITGSTFPGVLLQARPIGLLKMADEKGEDDKVLCVAAHDPSYEHVKELEDLPPHFLKEVSHFFQTYKELEGKLVLILGWEGRKAALAFIEQCIHAHEGSHA